MTTDKGKATAQKVAGYTPGPWEVHENNLIRQWGRYQVLHPLINQDGPYKGQRGGYLIVVGQNEVGPILSKADARLIAAAPDLLEAVIYLVESPQSHNALLKALDAIAKATGEEK